MGESVPTLTGGKKDMTSVTEIDGVNAALAADEEGLFSSEFSNVAPARGTMEFMMH
jgi:hypothetical protein